MTRKKCFLHKKAEDCGPCSGDLFPRKSFTEEQLRLLHIRTKCNKSIKHVCDGHHAAYIKFFENHERTCSDPFNDHGTAEAQPPPKKKKKASSSSLREITPELRDKAKLLELKLIPGRKVCIACNVKLNTNIKNALEKLEKEGKSVPVFESSPSVHSSQPSLPASVTPTANERRNPTTPDEPFVESLDGLNSWLSSVGFTPVSKEKLETRKNYAEKTFQKIRDAIAKCCQGVPEERSSSDLDQIVKQLKEFIDNHAEPAKKILALSVVPKSWTYKKIQEIFGVSSYLARRSRKLVQEHGILTYPQPKPGHGLSEETRQLVISYYLRDDVSRPLPGSKDVVSVRENGVRVKKTKRLILSTLQDLHNKFCEEFPSSKISRSKFCELRPKECVLAGSPGTHTICVCVYHQNPILMFEAANLKQSGLDSIKDCKKMLMCEEPTDECKLRKCPNCPDHSALQEHLEVFFDSELITHVTYNQWESTDRGTIVPIRKKVDDFIVDFISQLEKLITHHFIAKRQAEFKKETIKNIKEDEIVVNLDFAENFSFVVQNSSQGWYFNNKQATLHPCVINYKKDGKEETSSLVLISDHMDHSTVAVHKFQEHLIKHVTEKLGINVKKIYYFSDGCAAQYKNKKAVANIGLHQRDFGIATEWHYFATSHGKSACDGVGGMIKHQCMLYCLRLSANDPQITNARAFFEWVDANIKGITARWVSTEEIKTHEEKLEVRFKTAFDIDGIQSNHAIIPRHPAAEVALKIYSTDTDFQIKKISTREYRLDFSDVRGFVTFTDCFEDWQLGCVSEGYEEDENFDVQVLVSSGKLNTFEFTDEVLSVNLQNILTVVHPRFVNKGKYVKLLVGDIKAANLKLNELKKK